MQGKHITDRIGWRVIFDRFVRLAQKKGIGFTEDEIRLLEWQLNDIDNLASLIWFSEAKAKILAEPLGLPYETVLGIINDIAGVKPE